MQKTDMTEFPKEMSLEERFSRILHRISLGHISNGNTFVSETTRELTQTVQQYHVDQLTLHGPPIAEKFA